MKKDNQKVLRELSEFLDIPLTPEELKRLEEQTSIDFMRKSAQDRSKDEKEKERVTRYRFKFAFKKLLN